MSSQLNRTETPLDKIDHLARAYFRAEMPDPWPDAPAVTTLSRPTAAARPRGSLWRSRLALAASIALLLAGQWVLSSVFSGYPTRGPEVPTDGGAAKVRRELPPDPMDLPPGPMPERNHR